MRLIYGVVLVAARLAAQDVVAPDCSVSGTVVNAVTGDPVAGAMVALEGERATGTGSATDGNGRWSVKGVACGAVRLSATHAGFFKGSYRTSDVHPAGIENIGDAVQLVSGSPVRDLKIVSIPEGSISGRVQDANGDPVPEAGVTVLRAAVRNGRRAMVEAHYINADGHGNFWMGTLIPGRYLVCADSSNLTYPVGGGGALAYVEDCYPGPREAGASIAMPISGNEVRVPLTLRTAPGLHVRGKVSGPPNMPPVSVQLARMPGDPLRDRTADGTLALLTFEHNGATAPNGTFDIAGVPPGAYRAEASITVSAESEGLFAEALVDVGAVDVNDVRLPLRPVGSIRGTVRWEGAKAGVPAQGGEVEVSLANLAGFAGDAEVTWDQTHRNFVMPLVAPGQYWFEVSTGENGKAWVKSAAVNGRDVLGQPISVDGAAGPVGIVVSEQTCDVDVTVTDVDGKPVAGHVLLTGGSGRPVTIHAGPDGHATKHGLPPGEYRAWAFEDIENVPWAEEAWMSENAGAGEKVTVTLGSVATVTVKRRTRQVKWAW